YGVSITAPAGVLCIGGADGNRHYSECFVLSWNEGILVQTPAPPLPISCANSCGALLKNVVYVCGGTETPADTCALRTLFALDLDRLDAGWRELEPLPGPGRILAVAASQDGSFFVVSGAELSPDADGKPRRTYLRDGYRFTPGKGWRAIADVPRAVTAAPSPAPSCGPMHFLVFGGDDGTLATFEPKSEHPGFSRDVYGYHTLTNTWTVFGQLPAPRVTAPVVLWRDRTVVVSGEMRPGVRSPEVWAAVPSSNKPGFGWINYLTLALYPVIMIGISVIVGRKATTDQYFRGGQRIPWWAAGLSIFATVLSSITFMAIPAKAYAGDWSFTLANFTILFMAPVIVAVFLPFFRQLNLTTAYEYLERRFNLAARWFGSASFILIQFGRTAIVLYLPALALSTVSQFPIELCLIAMGAITLVMTFKGGIESVIWTDVAQSAILLVAAVATLLVIAAAVPGGWTGIWNTAVADGKFYRDLPWNADMAVAGGWVILVGNSLSILISYVGSQDVVQRYVSTPTQAAAARAIWTNAVMTIPATLLFFGIGTALYVFYKNNPSHLDPRIGTDAIFPLFMVREMPAGLGGLVVAGVFAAAQPTSSLNSIAAAWVTDFHSRLFPDHGDERKLRVARIVTIVSGVGGTAIALAMTLVDIRSLWDAFLTMLGLSGGALAGLFCLGICSTRANGRGAMVGVVASILVISYVKLFTPLHFFTYGGIGILTCMIVGYAASWVLPDRQRDLTGLTLFTKRSSARVEPSI
ncbi:MAG: solute:Na+ symporter, family, partial [Candidatus Hydrogenedentes bacterium]|nr:solute:Na+ symporter, family [Candidatus Hydrogenedentota bacterium]